LKFDRRPYRAEGEKMTKQALKGITMLVIIISLAFITAVVTANAQATGRLKAEVGHQLRTSTSEKAIDRELARNNSEPETVTIIASLR
jgi:hypothetical protein